MDNHFDEVVSCLGPLKVLLQELPEERKAGIYDVRLRKDGPVCLCGRDGISFLGEDGGARKVLSGACYCCSAAEFQEIFLRCCGHSVFSHENEICQGYLLANGSIRIGLCGTAVVEAGRIKNVKDITSMVLRIPREIPGCADSLFLRGIPLEKGLLLVGAPSSGKTTFLKDFIGSLASGKFSPGRRVAILDERGELGGRGKWAAYGDFLRGYPKKDGFETAIRMLSPEFLICDELSDKEVEPVRRAVFSGVPLVASVHSTYEEFLNRPLCRELLETGAFSTLVFLKGREAPTKIQRIESVDTYYENRRFDSSHSQRPAFGAGPGKEAAEKGSGAA